jgi:hypothetical protein
MVSATHLIIVFAKVDTIHQVVPCLIALAFHSIPILHAILMDSVCNLMCVAAVLDG